MKISEPTTSHLLLETDMSQWKISKNYFDKMVMPSLSIWFSHSTECNLKILRSSFILFKDYMKKYYSYQSFWIGPPPFFFPIFQLSTIFHLNDSKVFFYLIELLIQIQNLRIIKLLLQVTSFLNCKGIWLHAEFVTNHMKVTIGHVKISGIWVINICIHLTMTMVFSSLTVHCD